MCDPSEIASPAGSILRGNPSFLNFSAIHPRPSSPGRPANKPVPSVTDFEQIPSVEPHTPGHSSRQIIRNIILPKSPLTSPRESPGSSRRLLTSGASPENHHSADFPDDDPPSQLDSFEVAVLSTVDHSIGTFKRLMASDLANALRPGCGYFDSSLFDNFTADLLIELSALFDPDPASSSRAESSLIAGLNYAFEESAKPVRRLFQELEVRASQVRDRHLIDLKQIVQCLGDLRLSMKSIIDTSLQELEKERVAVSSRRDQEEARLRDLERKSRSLQLRLADTNSRLHHQKIELRSIKKLHQQLDATRREWEERTAETSNALESQLEKEAELLQAELKHDSTLEFDRSLDQCLTILTAVKDGLRDEVCEMDLAEKWAVSRLRSPVRRPPTSRLDSIGNNSRLQAIRDRIEANRIQRELSIKDVNESIRVLDLA
jgi:hypothetical protein